MINAKKEHIWSRAVKYLSSAEGSSYLFILPSIILLLMFSLIPLVISFGVSFFNAPMTLNPIEFVGLSNFREAFSDSRFLNSLKVTAIFTLIEVPIPDIRCSYNRRNACKKHSR